MREQLAYSPKAADTNEVIPIFIGTTRAKDPALGFGRTRQYAPTYVRYDISVPSSHVPGQIIAAQKQIDPSTQFLATSRVIYPTNADFRTDLARAFRERADPGREAVIYVHGFNNAFDEGVLRISQLAEDFDFPGVAVHYSWPSAAKPLN